MALPGFTGIVSEFYYNHGHFSEDNTIRQAVKPGTNLLFSGWGGDEFVSTGERGVSLDLLRGLHFRIFFRRNPIKNFRNFVKNQLFYVVYPAFNILDRNIKKSFSDDARYIRKAFKKSDRKAIRNFYFHTSRHQLHLRMLRFYHLQDRCESWMLNGYRNGIEYRYPLLDRRIIEYMLKVPTLLLCKNNNFRPLLRELGRDLLPEEVRWNWSKNDPVWWSHMKSLYKESSALFMEEADRWKDNTELDFIDFDLLFSDIGKYKHDPGSIDGLVLFRALVYIKAIHEFTSVYHGRR